MNNLNPQRADFLLVGGGIMGLAIAREIQRRKPSATITMLEKEAEIAEHSSGRNSGVLHAGFYYTPDSLKARFTRLGNERLAAFCTEQGVGMNACGKVVVARDDEEGATLNELERRARANRVDAYLINERELREIDPNVRTLGTALFSPRTSTVDPREVCAKLLSTLRRNTFSVHLGTKYTRRLGAHAVEAQGRRFEYGRLVNVAGLYADAIAHDFKLGSRYTILPFKGLYLKQTGTAPTVKVNVYPVPKLANPFLGVHFTVTATGVNKIGPTAIPALWRENYGGLGRFRAGELASILGLEASLFLRNSFRFRDLAFEELRKFRRSNLLADASSLVRNLDVGTYRTWSEPGIRAQLYDRESRNLVQDFVVESDAESVHVLNAVSPAFTCSFPFAEWVYEKYLA